MNQYVTVIRAIDPLSGELKTYGGPNVPGLTARMAQAYCQRNDLGYCHVLGPLIAEIPTKADGHTADFDKMTDYEAPSLN